MVKKKFFPETQNLNAVTCRNLRDTKWEIQKIIGEYIKSDSVGVTLSDTFFQKKKCVVSSGKKFFSYMKTAPMWVPQLEQLELLWLLLHLEPVKAVLKTKQKKTDLYANMTKKGK